MFRARMSLSPSALPFPTRMISNGEYMPVPQTDKQKRVEARIEELTAEASKKLGVDRRQFLRSSGGMAAAMLAMNEVFGRFFDVSLDGALRTGSVRSARARRRICSCSTTSCTSSAEAAPLQQACVRLPRVHRRLRR